MKSFITLTLACFCAVMVMAQNGKIPFSNTIKIEAGDSQERIIEKAAHVIPTANQLDALRNEFIAFIHFGPNTFTRLEWGSGFEDPKIFDLKTLNTDQWCEAMQSAGMTMVIITVKHHDGFVLWQSRYTEQGVMSSGFENGTGDILKNLSESCKKYGIKLGVYLSPADLYQIENAEGLYGNGSPITKRTIPRAVEGRPFANKTTFEFEVDDYNEYFLNQLFEILTEYGEIHEVWFDGAHPKRKGNQQYNYAAWKEVISTLAPKAVTFGREDIRWCGNESGGTRDTEWNVIPYNKEPKEIGAFPDLTHNDIASRQQLYKAKYLHYQQAETNTSIREGWFYRDDTHQKVRSADDVFDIYERSVGGNSTFLLNIPPNREGHFSPTDVEVLKEVGKRIRETYGTSLLTRAKGAKQVLDGNPNTFALLSKKQELLISTRHPVTINRLVVQEAIATHGERVEKHAVDAWIDGAWREIASATNIGYKRILRFPEVTTTKIRFRVLESRATPAISHFSAHFYKTRPPQLMAAQDKNGWVTIAPLVTEFNWKPHGENAAENLNAGLEIFYTTDGTDPDASGLKYEKPFKMEQGMLKTVSVIGGEKGAIHTQRIGIAKAEWRVHEASSQRKNHAATLAFDADQRSFWQSEEGENHAIAIDLGKSYTLNGFAYTPQTRHSEGMMAKGRILSSNNGTDWQVIEIFEFGNLINDPTQRFHFFKAPLQTRFIRVVADEIANNGKSVAIAEIELF